MVEANVIAMHGLSEESELRERVRAVMDTGSLSQTKAATEIGISAAALSQWLAGKYPGDGSATDARVLRWLDAKAQRAKLDASMPSAPAWVETPTARRVLAGLQYAQMSGDISLVYGGAGIGKTQGARRYAALHPNVWVATMTAATNALGPCLERVALACGMRPSTTRAARLESDLIDRLTDTDGLLVIDEAQHLATRALEALRALHDATGVGLAILGNDLVYARLTGGRRSAEFAQLFSRIGKRVRLTRPSEGDVSALIAAWGIDGEKEVRVLMDIARKPGALRGVTKALRLASLFAQGQGEPAVTATHIVAAWRDLGGEL
ncbi:MAG: AAA family ATPase [Pseudomonadales bacterium]|nr:AAA family ATPase [Pseudomonadales bacterium]